MEKEEEKGESEKGTAGSAERRGAGERMPEQGQLLRGLGDGRRAEVAAAPVEAGREGQELVREQRVRLTNVDRGR